MVNSCKTILSVYFDYIADPPTFQLHTEQFDDQVPTLLDGKFQLQLAKEKKPTLEPAHSESEIQVDTQLCASKYRQHNNYCDANLGFYITLTNKLLL